MNQTLYPDVTAYHLPFRLLNPERGLSFTEHIQIHLLELPKFRRRLEALHDPLDKWLYFFLHAETMDTDKLPTAFDKSVYQCAAKELEKNADDPRERERYEAREKAIRDQISFIHEAKEQVRQAREEGLKKGLEEGRKEGLKEGRKQGRREGKKAGLQEGRQEGLEAGELIGRIHLCEQRLRRAVTPCEELAELPLDELRRQAEALEKELFGS